MHADGLGDNGLPLASEGSESMADCGGLEACPEHDGDIPSFFTGM